VLVHALRTTHHRFWGPPMSITLYLSPTTESSLAHLLAQMQEVRRADLFLPVHLLLPSARTIRYVRRELGSALGVDLCQFYGLGQSVLDAASGAVHELSDTAIRRLVCSLLAQMDGAGELTSFAAVHQTNGFVDLMIGWLREMKGQRIHPDQVSAEAERSGLQRDRQLATLYQRYQRTLQTRRLSDTEGLLWLATEALEGDEMLFQQPGPFFILGFDQFTPVQLDFLEQLCGRFERCAIYLSWDAARPAESLVLSRLRSTRHKIEKVLSPRVETLPAVPGPVPLLDHLRRSLLEPHPESQPVNDSPAIRAVAAPSREEEVRWALRHIKGLLLAGVPPHQIGLLAPHPDVYAGLVRAIAAEYEIPVAVDKRLDQIPVVTALLALLDLPPTFPWRQTFDALRSPYIRQPWISPEAIEALDRITRERPVLAGREQWLAAVKSTARQEEHDDDEDRRRAASASGRTPEEMAALAAGLKAFFDHLTPPATASYEEYVCWLQQAILGLGDDDPEAAEESAATLDLLHRALAGEEAEGDRQALAILLRALRALVVAVDLVDAAAPVVEWPTFLADLRAALAGIRLPPDTSQTGVTFDALEGGRATPVDHLLVLGLSEGEFPQPPPPDPLYAPPERDPRQAKLPLRFRDPGEEASLWWQILANCRHKLILLRPRLDENGAEWPPSPYFDAVLATVADLPVQKIPIAPPPLLDESACASELLVALAYQGGEGAPAELAPAWRQAEAGLAISRLRQGWQEAGIYEGRLTAGDLCAELDDHFGPHHRWSASRLSRYASCPAGFFAEQVLSLEALAEPVEGMDAAVRGTILHAVMEGLVRALAADAIAICSANQQQILAQLRTVCDAIFQDAPRRYGFHPNVLWEYEQAELHRILCSLIEWECEQNGDEPRFHPFQQELHFGLRDRPPLRLDLVNGESILVGGVVDRVDRDAGGHLRIIDYKSGSTKYSSSHLRDGTAIQAALYALAVEEILAGQGRVVHSSYWHLAIREESGRLTFDGVVASHEDVQAMLAQVARLVIGVRQGHFPGAPARPMEGGTTCRRDCPFTPFCRVSRSSIAKSRRRNQDAADS
jgi:ATP-dependent helicase/DNAse subunit B